MAQLQGIFSDRQTAMLAVEKLRAMDIPDEDIVINQEGKGDNAQYLLSAEIPDGQFSAAQAIVNAAIGGAGTLQSPGGTTSGGNTSATVAADAITRDDEGETYSGRGEPSTAGVLGTRTDEGATADPDTAAMAGPGVIGAGALGGPAALTARAAAIGSADELLDEELDRTERTDPDNQGDTINSVSPR